jgi:hypothetical protein
VKNATFAQELGRALHRPALMRMPALVLHPLLGDLADELLLGGQRVLPDKADAGGFKFRHDTLRTALSAMFGGQPATEGRSELVVAPEMPHVERLAPAPTRTRAHPSSAH